MESDNTQINRIKLAQKQVLDLIEASYGHTEQWGFVRSRILHIFGRQGLQKNLVNGTALSQESEYLGADDERNTQ